MKHNYEYLVIKDASLYMQEGTKKEREFLNKLGQDGWELVSHMVSRGGDNLYYFKRRCIYEY